MTFWQVVTSLILPSKFTESSWSSAALCKIELEAIVLYLQIFWVILVLYQHWKIFREKQNYCRK
jgi:hypothetical protein